MIYSRATSLLKTPAWQALSLWILFIVTALIINGTLPFLLGNDMHAWTYSPLKSALFHFLIYGILFFVCPVTIVKGWSTVRQPGFILPMLFCVMGIGMRSLFWPEGMIPTAILVVPILAYLHGRYNLSELGIRSRGWRGDLAVILLWGFLIFCSVFLEPSPQCSFSAGKALKAALSRMFLNPASTTENLFYFGFLTERLSSKTGWLTPFLVGLMYTAHEMSNPEYWYSGMQFYMVFLGITITAAMYLWRRSLVVIWLGDGLGRFVNQLFT